MQQALVRAQARMGLGGERDSGPLMDHAAVVFGYQYRSSAIVGASGNGGALLRPEELSGQPGTRAPHVAVTLNGRRISTIDLYGRHFVVLAGAGGEAWVAGARRVAQRLDIPLAAYRFGGELIDADGEVAHGIGLDGALLVRPDGFVAWRNPVADERPERALEKVLVQMLSRETVPVAASVGK